MSRVFIDCSIGSQAPWVSGRCSRYNQETDEHDNPDGVWGCGKIFPWGGIEIASVSDEVPKDERSEIEALITAAPEMFNLLSEMARTYRTCNNHAAVIKDAEKLLERIEIESHIDD